MKNWYLHQNRELFEKLQRMGKWSNLQTLLLANRQIDEEQKWIPFLEPGLHNLHNPFEFKDMEKAVDLIATAIDEGEHIRIIGDYDQDGVSSTVILMKALRKFTPLVTYMIPDRMEDGYGINPEMVQKAQDEGVSLIITCDNGIAAFEAFEKARELGIKTVLTDHHTIVTKGEEEVLPDADAILNPHSVTSGYPFPDLCGAGVAFKLVQGLYYGLGAPEEELFDLLGFAALGTVCDVMDLVGENRTIVREGLKALNQSTNPGLLSLLQKKNWNQPIDVYTCGFIIGPCINASGRLFTASLGVELFLEKDLDKVNYFANELVSLNDQRIEMTEQGEGLAVEMVEELDSLPSVILLYIPELHESLCGLVAGRIKEKYSRPTLVFTDSTEEEGYIKGSGRSIPAYHMYDEMKKQDELYSKFGGHKMACGLTLKKENFEELKTRLNDQATLTERDFQPDFEIDAEIPLRAINYKMMDDIEELEPYGKAFPKPVFATKNLNVRNMRVVGRNQNVLLMQVEQSGTIFRCVGFQAEEWLKYLDKKWGAEFERALRGQPNTIRLDVLYCPEWNEYNGTKSVQLKIKDLR